MKINMFKLFFAVLMVCVLAVAGFGQRSHGGFNGRSGGFHSSAGSSFSSAPRSTGSFRRSQSTSSFLRSSRSSRPAGSLNRSSFRAGFRPSVSVHYFGYGGPGYFYGGHRVYWYGKGYYALYPGGPFIMGNPAMPGYSESMGYYPGYGEITTITTQNGTTQTTFIRSNNVVGQFLFCVFFVVVVALLLIVIKRTL